MYLYYGLYVKHFVCWFILYDKSYQTIFSVYTVFKMTKYSKQLGARCLHYNSCKCKWPSFEVHLCIVPWMYTSFLPSYSKRYELVTVCTICHHTIWFLLSRSGWSKTKKWKMTKKRCRIQSKWYDFCLCIVMTVNLIFPILEKTLAQMKFY